MAPPEDLVRLRHLREAAEQAIGFSAVKTRQTLEDDEVLRLALTKLIEIVGEAVNLVTSKCAYEASTRRCESGRATVCRRRA